MRRMKILVSDMANLVSVRVLRLPANRLSALRIGGILMSGDAAVGIADRMTTGTNRHWPLSFAWCRATGAARVELARTAATARTSALLPSPRRRATAGPARRPRQCVSKNEAASSRALGRQRGDLDMSAMPTPQRAMTIERKIHLIMDVALPKHVPAHTSRSEETFGVRPAGGSTVLQTAAPCRKGVLNAWARRSGISAAGVGSLLALRV